MIGVSDLCDYPPEARGKPVVSRGKVDPEVLSSEQVEEAMRRLLTTGESPYDLDQDWLMRHKPDVVLTQDICYYCEVDAGQVRDAVADLADAPEVEVLQPQTFEGILDSIRQVGSRCGVPERAKALVDSLQTRVSGLQDDLPAVAERPRVFSLEGINPIVIGGNWIPDLIRLAGGRLDDFPPGCPARRIQWEEVLEYQPEKLLIDLCSSDLNRSLREIPWLAVQPGWNSLHAVESGEVYLIDHVYFSRPGPRVITGMEILAQIIHPQLFSGMVPRNSVLKLDPQLAQNCPPEDIAACFRPYPPF